MRKTGKWIALCAVVCQIYVQSGRAQVVTSSTVMRSTHGVASGIPPQAMQQMARQLATGSGGGTMAGSVRASSRSFLDQSTSAAAAQKTFQLDAAMYSVGASGKLEDINIGASGTASGMYGSLGLAIKRGTQDLRADVEMTGSNGRLKVKLSTSGSDAGPTREELDLTDMKAKSIELARDPNGTVYMLNLMPGIRKAVSDAPKSLSAYAAKLQTMQFRDAPMILDDSDYLGSISGSGFEYAWVDVAGQTRVEFSLLPMRDAQPIGTLDNGRIRLTDPEGKRLDITGVASEITGQPLPDGPYTVYGRWLPPSETIEQAKANAAKLVEQADIAGMPPGAKEHIQKLIERINAGKPVVTSHGGGGLPPENKVQ